jgi:multiple sugar transport system substrate-binding protein
VKWVTEKAREYEKKSPGTKIDVRAFPGGEMRAKVFTGLSSGAGPTIFDLFSADFLNVATRNIAAPVDWSAMGYASADEFAKQWVPTAINATQYEGKYYAVPFLGNAFSLFINKKHFVDAGLNPETDAPKTWEDLARVAEKLTVRQGDRLVRRGYDLPYAQGQNWWSNQFNMMTRQAGGEVLSQDGAKATLNGEAGQRALTLLADLVHKYKVTAPGLGTATPVLPNQDFVEQTTSMWFSGNWAIDTFPKDSEIRKNFMVVPTPQFNPSKPRSLISGWWWFVAANASNDQRREAWRFLQFILEPGEQLAATGLLMPKRSIIDSAEWKAFPFHAAFQRDLEAGEWTFSSVKYPEIEGEIAKAMERAVVNTQAPKASLDEAAANIDRILAR